jgi:hypothetical protein
LNSAGSSRTRHSIWQLAMLIAVVRVGALWAGVAGLSRGDWWQIPSYFAVMTALPDIYVVKALRAHPLVWGIAGTLTLTATSPLWAAAFVWLAGRPRRAQAV